MICPEIEPPLFFRFGDNKKDGVLNLASLPFLTVAALA
jgi:hypothetical protein